MDDSSDWTTSTLYSPSKAHAQKALARDWASVDDWLSRKYASKRLPAFERNEDTLQALLKLASASDNADEQRSHIDKVQRAALAAYRKDVLTVSPLYAVVISEGNSNTHLDLLATTFVDLDCARTDIGAACEAVVDLTSDDFNSKQSLALVTSQIDALLLEQERIRLSLAEIRQASSEASPQVYETTADYLRDTKHVKAKIVEYDDRLASLQSARSDESLLATMISEVHSLAEQRKYMSQLSDRLDVYQSLPTDLMAARAQVEDSRSKLLKLVRKRDQMFEALADG